MGSLYHTSSQAVLFVVMLHVSSGKMADLTHELSKDAIFWPTVKSFKMTGLIRHITSGGWWYEIEDISASTHGGTHLDAPSHFSKGKWRTHEIPFDHFVGPLVLIDIRHRSQHDPNAQLRTKDLLEWEAVHGAIPDGAFVLMNSGWSQYWPDKQTYLGTESGDTSKLRFPGIHTDVARWLVNNRSLHGVGVDTASVDYGLTKDFMTHRIFAAANVLMIENVRVNSSLPASGAEFMVWPVKIRDASGAPCRVIAKWNDKKLHDESKFKVKTEM